jgi:pimeloyl-ACP methyl ester carboxylesterase
VKAWRAIAVAAAVTVAGLIGGCSSGPETPTTIAGYYSQQLSWQSCDNGFQCATLLVPRDYSRPGWARFSLPVVKLAASDPAHRIGSLVINPGGPGGSGVQYALGARSILPAAILARFDVVGFDPRGVGGSDPAVQCLTGPQLDQYFEVNESPADAAQLNAVVRAGKEFAAGCEQDSASLLPYVGTQNAARDMDVLRAALGDAKLTYLGKSYGTYLGAWYAQLFPGRVRALVLDGAVDPDTSAIGLDVVQAQGFEVALRSFIGNCQRSYPDCPVGRGTVAQGVARVQQMIGRAYQAPLVNKMGNGQIANGAMMLSGVAAALYSTSFWGDLRTGLADAFNGDGTVLLELANLLTERNPDGSYSNLSDANTAINCVDRPWPKSLAEWQAAATQAAALAPMFGAPDVWGGLACAYWPVSSSPLPALRAQGAPPILVIGTLRDPATPYRWAQALASGLASGVLLGWNGDGHTAYGEGSTCVDGIVNAYFTALAVPRGGTVCST